MVNKAIQNQLMRAVHISNAGYIDLLIQHPEIDINAPNDLYRPFEPALVSALRMLTGAVDKQKAADSLKVAEILLNVPGIDVNAKGAGESTTLSVLALSHNGSLLTEEHRFLLKKFLANPKVDLRRGDDEALREAIKQQCPEIVARIMLAYKARDLELPREFLDEIIYHAYWKRMINPGIKALVEASKDEKALDQEIARQFPHLIKERLAADIFAQIVFVSDDLLQLLESKEGPENQAMRFAQAKAVLSEQAKAFEQLDPTSEQQAMLFEKAKTLCSSLLGCVEKLRVLDSTEKQAPTVVTEAVDKLQNARRFFKIASKLPLELQMVLSNRVAESTETHILAKDSEPAFRRLAEGYTAEAVSKQVDKGKGR